MALDFKKTILIMIAVIGLVGVAVGGSYFINQNHTTTATIVKPSEKASAKELVKAKASYAKAKSADKLQAAHTVLNQRSNYENAKQGE